MIPNRIKTSFVVLAFILLTCVSCFSIKEEIYLNSDGSGKYLVYTDMIAGSRDMMLGMMSSMNPDADQDSLMKVVEDQLWQQYPSEIDSILDFSDKIPDSIKNDPDKQKYLERMEMFMEGGREKGYVNSGIRFTFNSMDDLEELMDLLDQSSRAGSGEMPMPSTKVKYAFDKKSFSRTAIIEDEKVEMNDSTMMALSAMLENSSWQLIVHLPKKVKKASSDQLVKNEGKDVIYEYDLLKIISGEQSMSMKVDF